MKTFQNTSPEPEEDTSRLCTDGEAASRQAFPGLPRVISTVRLPAGAVGFP